MQYDTLNYEDLEAENCEPMTLGELMEDLANAGDIPVVFLGTHYTVGNLMSWRGSYDIPAISYERGYKTAKEIYEQLQGEIKATHWGYKGGEYKYSPNDTFYVSKHSYAEEFMIVKTEVQDGELVLYTKIIPY